MAEIIPFRGLLYNVEKVSGDGVLAPPYDIISPAYRKRLYGRSPYNIVRIDFGEELPGDDETNNRYARAKAFLSAWQREGILIRSEHPSFYIYEMTYRTDGGTKRLAGILGLVRLEELGKGSIYPHECTYSKPKQDRLNLMKYCGANISPIFSLYKSGEKNISGILSSIISDNPPYMEARDDDGALHRLWQCDDPGKNETIVREMADKPVFIADGHHRYETAYEFHREMSGQMKHVSGMQPHDYVLMFLVNMIDEGLTILPTHRLIKDMPEDIIQSLSKYFEMEPVEGDFDIAQRLSGRKRSFGFFQEGKDKWHILTYKGGDLSEVSPHLRDIDVFILHELIIKKIFHTTDIGYEMDVREALDKVRRGEFNSAFFLNPTRVEDVETAALSSMRMPPKSTYFYPKLLTGLVLNKWETLKDTGEKQARRLR